MSNKCTSLFTPKKSLKTKHESFHQAEAMLMDCQWIGIECQCLIFSSRDYERLIHHKVDQWSRLNSVMRRCFQFYKVTKRNVFAFA